MTSFIVKKIFKESLENRFGKEDPYFETLPAKRLGEKPKKRRKANPPGLSDHDNRVLTKVKRRAYRLDLAFASCGLRFGWSSVIGFVPGLGDVADMLLSIMVLRTAQQVEGGLPAPVLARMVANIMIDFGIGLVPFVGDVVDAIFRANTKNAALLEEHLREKGLKNLRASGLPAPVVDPSDPIEFDREQREAEGAAQPVATTARGSRARNELRSVEEARQPRSSKTPSKSQRRDQSRR